MQRNLVVIACVMLGLAAGARNKEEQVTHFGPPPGLLQTSTPSFNRARRPRPFDCGALASSDGKVTVTARGSFTASG